MRRIGLLALLAAMACGGGGTSTGTREDFLGSWSATLGSVVLTPSSGSQQTQSFVGSVNIAVGEGTNGIRFTDPNGCTIGAQVNGTSAIFNQSAQCTESTAVGPITLTWNAGSLSRAGDIMSMNATGTYVSNNSGFSGTGTFSISANLKRAQ